MRVKVVDFGLVKNVFDGKYFVVIRLVGIFGYFVFEYVGNYFFNFFDFFFILKLL